MPMNHTWFSMFETVHFLHSEIVPKPFVFQNQIFLDYQSWWFVTEV